MSLVANGPETVTIYSQETVTDFQGNPVERPSSNAYVAVGVQMQPIASARGAFGAVRVDGGQDVLVAYKLMLDPRQFPGLPPLNWWSRVTWVDERGDLRSFSILGGPLSRRNTPMVNHVSCTLAEER